MLLNGRFATIACLQLLIFGFFHVEGRKGFGCTDQEWGYVTVRPQAKMFWWLYYTTSNDVNNVRDKPLLIWLQGGPGGSSTGYGNFEELGPLDSHLNPRNFTWVKDYNVLFIDNPVGSGYSYAERSFAYARNNAQIAADLLECVRGFYDAVPELLSVPVYITTESYGGKMGAEFALVWDKAQKTGNMSSNFQGVLLIDSWISPIDSVLSWATYLLNTGMVDTQGFNEIEEAAQRTKAAIERKSWVMATRLWGRAESVIFQMTGNIDFYNILNKVNYQSREKSSFFWPILPSARMARDDSTMRLDRLMNNEVKKALNLSGVTWGSQSDNVFEALAGDFMKPVTNIVERLLNETDIEVFVISGQLDLIVATPGTVEWVEKLKWRNSTDWHNAPRQPLVVNGNIEGYVKQYKNFKMYWVNRSGHMVPKDNPAATGAILEHLTAS